MSWDPSVTLVWGDGEYTFRLGIGELRELDAKTGVGPGVLHARLVAGTWRVDEPREVLRLGLIGGGLSPGEAYRLVVRYYDNRPKMESIPFATVILLATLARPDDMPGKPNAAGDATETTQTAASPSPPSTEPVASSASRPDKSIH